MAAAGALVAAALRAVHEAAAPGVSTLALDEIAESVIRDAGGTPSFLGYHGFPRQHLLLGQRPRGARHPVGGRDTGAPATWCPSTAARSSTAGTAIRRSRSASGTLIPADETLSQATRESMEAGIAAMVPGNRLTDVSHAIETGTRAAEERYGRQYGIVEGYGGHGIGRQMHMDPFLPNEGAPGRGRIWRRVRCWPSSRC